MPGSTFRLAKTTLRIHGIQWGTAICLIRYIWEWSWGHMMGYTELKNAYQFVTTNAAKTLHITDHYGIEVGTPANFLIVNGSNFYDVLNQHAEVLYSIRNGKILVKTQPKKSSAQLLVPCKKS